MIFAIADPPYFGQGQRLYGKLHAKASDYDKIQTWVALVERLNYYDGWALHMTSGNLHEILPLCPKDARVMAWVKPFAVFKPNVGVAYSWEPVIVRGGRRRTRKQPTVRDWCAVNIALRKGMTGAKPRAVVWWLMDVLNVEPDDQVDDLFPGSGEVGAAIDVWREARTGECSMPLFA